MQLPACELSRDIAAAMLATLRGDFDGADTLVGTYWESEEGLAELASHLGKWVEVLVQTVAHYRNEDAAEMLQRWVTAMAVADSEAHIHGTE